MAELLNDSTQCRQCLSIGSGVLFVPRKGVAKSCASTVLCVLEQQWLPGGQPLLF